MKKTFRRTLAQIGATFMLMLLPMAMPAVAHAADAGTNIANGVGCGTELKFTNTAVNNCGATNSNTSNLQTILADVINIFSVVVGIIAVVMIIVGGLKYITSGGESSKVSGAQSTILYAIVGLVVVVLAQVIVHFVLNRVAPSANAG
ncbi:MAG TPA: hypothetical protein VMR95_03745 [Candidatus Binatia bacterium]|nr:hypothetical protein [Candidatus Binatia bacterium]